VVDRAAKSELLLGRPEIDNLRFRSFIYLTMQIYLYPKLHIADAQGSGNMKHDSIRRSDAMSLNFSTGKKLES
jgi:hypothetical protein